MNTSGFFDNLFENARYNGILIMNTDGEIINANEAFSLRFGYVAKELTGKNFSMLFTHEDKALKKPELEIQKALTEGAANDENYIVNKEGNKVWVTGESVLIKNEAGKYIVKVIHNIHAQKQLERFLLQSHEFIDTVFDSIDDSALLILDTSIRIVKSNKAFIEMFDLKQPPGEGSRLTDLDHPFWQNPDVKQTMINFLTTQGAKNEKIFELKTGNGEMKKISLHSKLIEAVPGRERKLLVMIKYV